jgi:tetratricopeptide (TPR) repeat protein
MLRRSTASRVAGLFVAFSLALVVTPISRADSISFGGLALDEVQITEMRDGNVYFINAGGAQVSNEIARIGQIKIDTIPELARGEQLLADRSVERAIDSFKAARAKARPKWLQNWIDARMLAAYDQTDKPIEAFNLFERMVKADADVGLFTLVYPNKSIVHLNAEQKQQMLDKLGELLKQKPKETGAGIIIEKVRVMVEQHDVEAATIELDRARQEGRDITQIKAPLPKTAVAMPLGMIKGVTDPVTKLLMAGQFEQALQQANASLEANPSDALYRRLYQIGLAKLALAERSNDQAMMKDAGLAFMRIIVYSPRGAYAGPAYIEAGRVHQAIGRPDIARTLWEQASNYIIEDEEPLLHERLDKLKGSLNAGASTNGP